MNPVYGIQIEFGFSVNVALVWPLLFCSSAADWRQGKPRSIIKESISWPKGLRDVPEGAMLQ
jgi:hypothetical protein